MDYWTVARILNIRPPKVEKEITCGICGYLLKEAYQTPCGCRLCKDCIFEIDEKCEICKESWDEKTNQMIPDRATDKIINRRSVYCPFDECTTTDEFRQIQRHMDQCKWKRERCKMCGWTIMSTQVKKHMEQECPEQEQSCEYCGISMTKKKLLEDHWKIAETTKQKKTTCKFYQQVTAEVKKGTSKENILTLLNFIRKSEYEKIRRGKKQQLKKMETMIKKEKGKEQRWEKQRKKSDRIMRGVGYIENNFTWVTELPGMQITRLEFKITGWLAMVKRTKRDNGYIITKSLWLQTSKHKAYLKIYPNGTRWKTNQQVTATIIVGNNERKNTKKRSIEDSIHITMEAAPGSGYICCNDKALKRKKINHCLPGKGKNEIWENRILVATSKTLTEGKYMEDDTVKIRVVMCKAIPIDYVRLRTWLVELKLPRTSNANIECQKTWKLRNIELCNRDSLLGLEWKFDSLPFQIGLNGDECRLRIAPFGCGKGKDDYISIALIITRKGKESSAEQDTEKTVQFKFTSQEENRQQWSVMQKIKKYEEAERSEMQTKGSRAAVCEKFVPLSKIFNRRNECENDLKTIECCIWKKDPDETLRY